MGIFNQCVILVGGLGSRLGELTKTTPKPLLPVAGEPFLDHLLTELSFHHIRKILLLASFQSIQIEEFTVNSSAVRRFGLEITVSVEPVRAGTGGAIWNARHLLDENFLLLNGDSWFDISIEALVACKKRHKTSVATLALRHLEDVSRFGVVELEHEKIQAFHPRPDASRIGPGLVNGGVYAMSRDLFDYLSPSCSLEVDVFPGLARAGALSGVVFDGYFIDIGVPASYELAQTAIPQQRHAFMKTREAFVEGPGATVHE